MVKYHRPTVNRQGRQTLPKQMKMLLNLNMDVCVDTGGIFGKTKKILRNF